MRTNYKNSKLWSQNQEKKDKKKSKVWHEVLAAKITRLHFSVSFITLADQPCCTMRSGACRQPCPGHPALPACPAVLLPLPRCHPQDAAAGGHRAWCGRRDGNVQSEYRLSSAFPVKWPFLEQRPLSSGGTISSVKWSSSSRQALAVGTGCHHAGNLPPQGSGQTSLYVKTFSQRHLTMLDGDWCVRTRSQASLPVPHAGQGEADRQDVEPLLPAGAGTRGCSWPGPCGWEASLSSWLRSQVVTCLGSSSFPSRILLALLLLSTRFLGASQSGRARHLAQRQPPLQLRQVLTKSKCNQRSNMIALLQSSALTGMRPSSRHLANGLLVLMNFLSVCKIFRLI